MTRCFEDRQMCTLKQISFIIAELGFQESRFCTALSETCPWKGMSCLVFMISFEIVMRNSGSLQSVAKRSSQQGQRGSDQGVGGGQQPPRREIKLSSMSSMPRQERVEDPNAWKPKHASKSKEKDAKEGSETDELLKVVRGILNKITPSKYDKLLETFKELNIETEDQLSGVIKLFFEKVICNFPFLKCF